MKMNKMITSLAAVAVVNASALLGTGCLSMGGEKEYKIVERVTKDGTVEKCVVEKGVMDKVNDFGVENAGALRLLEVGGQYGFGIWNGVQGERQIRATRGISSAVKQNTSAVKQNTSALGTLLNTMSKGSNCNQ